MKRKLDDRLTYCEEHGGDAADHDDNGVALRETFQEQQEAATARLAGTTTTWSSVAAKKPVCD